MARCTRQNETVHRWGRGVPSPAMQSAGAPRKLKGAGMRLSKAMCLAGIAGWALVAAAGAGALNLSSVDPVPPKQPAKAVPVLLSRGLAKIVVAQGSDRLDGGTAANPYYGY